MKKALIAAGLLATSHFSFAGQAPHDRLNGTWTSDLVTLHIDFAKHEYSGVAMGDPFDQGLKLVKETPQYVIFTTDGKQIVAQFQEDGSVLFKKKGGIPLILHRPKNSGGS